MSNEVIDALSQFHQRYLDNIRQASGQLPTIEQDEEWPSPCEQGAAGHGEVFWQPKTTNQELDFAGMEHALNLALHPDLKSYYASFYSYHLSARSEDGDLELLQVWNQEDFNRLQENLIGHAMMKRKRRQPETFFIAVTDDDEIIISVINESGEVWAERVGQNPHRKLADSIPAFIHSLEATQR
ncbi:SecY-interacting protein [Parendozoicomonas haliclonae]|uniref:Protein Syd n=1 Tax=Parendozoicomonas haliclonae TaxID=1960125 RepID=A0A1X7AMF3_9GAMM|nr:SecY-interacting protein [Parendozoicomonas haliclonae]SMA49397.1 SecY interacting protein Syd [Parendozoicomonas haliclonae]